MKFKKIKYDGKKVSIEFYKGNVTDKDYAEIWSTESTKEPLDSFNECLQSLKSSVLEICSLPEDYADGMEIRSVTISHPKEIMGATITALKTLENTNSPLVLNTPFLPSAPYNEEDDGNTPLLPTSTVNDLEFLFAEAEKYIKGEIKQMSLFSVETKLEPEQVN